MNDDPTVHAAYEMELLGWIRKKHSEGIGVLKKEKAYNEMQSCIEFINGEQFPIRSRALSTIVDNRIRKIVLETVSALTDVRPIWNYDTAAEQYKPQSDILNKLARGWWKNSTADRKLQRTLTFSCAGGSGYAALTWNPDSPGGGDLELIPLDPRDVIPIEPIFTDSVQDWRGVMLRQRMPVDTVRAMYPSKAWAISGGSLSFYGPSDQRVGRIYSLATSMWDAIAGKDQKRDDLPGTVDLIRVYMKDDSIHTGFEPKQMGNPESNYSYTVYPVGSIGPDGNVVDKNTARLYPRGRMIVCTPDAILEDGPNPYWHGLFPIVRFTLDPLPWSILGASMVADLIPLQNALNEGLRGAEDGMAQWIKRGVVADRYSISPQNLQSLDTRKAGLKAHLNPTAGEGFKIIDGPEFPTWYMDMIAYFKTEMDEISGVKALQAMGAAQSQAMSQSDNDVDKFQEALSPLLRIRSRSIEVSLSELAEMLKVGFFQFYTARRRMQILGKDGVTLEDFDYDPNTMVPADEDGATTGERAVNHHKNFSFSVAPNSFLNVSHMTHKMLMLQLFRANGIDIWSMWDALDVGGCGPMPAQTVPERMVAARQLGLQPGPTPEMVQAQQQVIIAQAQAQMMQLQQMSMMGMGGMGGAPGGGGPPGGGGGAPPGGGIPPVPSNKGSGPQGGRPPSGQQAPQMIQKNSPEGPRMVTSESGK